MHKRVPGCKGRLDYENEGDATTNATPNTNINTGDNNNPHAYACPYTNRYNAGCSNAVSIYHKYDNKNTDVHNGHYAGPNSKHTNDGHDIEANR